VRLISILTNLVYSDVLRLCNPPLVHVPSVRAPDEHIGWVIIARWNRKYRPFPLPPSLLAHAHPTPLQAYFTFAFGANLIQTIFAGLQFNPVMNIMCLPFALVVSVIAATAVFRNVFTAYDAFSSEGVKHSGGSSGPMGLGGAHGGVGVHGAGGGSDKGLRTGARILFNHNTSTYAGGATTGGVTSIPLGDYKGGYSVDSETGDVKGGYGGVGAISVTKVVDVEVDGGRDQTVSFYFGFVLDSGTVNVVLMRCLCRALGCLRRGHEWIEHKTIST